MMIGAFKNALTFSTTSDVRSMYPCTGPQGKHVSVRSVVLGVPLLLSILASLATGNPAHAGNLKGPNQQATAEKFFDWGYAQKVWFEMNTSALIDAEYAKYRSDFEPWLALYKQDPRKAFAEMDKMPKAKRLRVQRGYDVQLAWDQWYDHVYSFWYNQYDFTAQVKINRVSQQAADTFDDLLARSSQNPTCHPNRLLNECGPVPDWRSERMHRESAEMMAETAKKVERKKADLQK